MKKHHKLQNTVLLGFFALAMVLIIVISIVVGMQYVDKEMENCRDTAFSFEALSKTKVNIILFSFIY